MYPSEMPYFNTENPVVRDELWDRPFYYSKDDDTEEIIYIDLFVDASKLSDEDYDEIYNQLDNLNHFGDEFSPESKFVIDDVWKYVEEDGKRYVETDYKKFTICGWATEFVVDKLFDCLNSYSVDWQDL